MSMDAMLWQSQGKIRFNREPWWCSRWAIRGKNSGEPCFPWVRKEFAYAASFEDLVSMVKEDEKVSPGIVFFPTHRMERMELDSPDGNISSLSQRFAAKTGLDPVDVFAPYPAAEGR